MNVFAVPTFGRAGWELKTRQAQNFKGMQWVLALMQAAQLLTQQARQHVVHLLHHVHAGGPLSRRLVQCAARGDEVGHVGDVHPHTPSPAAQRLYGQCIVQVPRRGWVDAEHPAPYSTIWLGLALISVSGSSVV